MFEKGEMCGIHSGSDFDTDVALKFAEMLIIIVLCTVLQDLHPSRLFYITVTIEIHVIF